MQAALGCGQLKSINKIVKRKREIGKLYFEKLKDNKKIILQKNKTKYANNIYWVFGVLLKKKNLSRNQIMKKLLKKNIDSRPFFSINE